MLIVAAFSVACEGGPAEPSRDGLSCLDTPAQHTCTTDGEALLECDDSSIWRTHLVCDDACAYTDGYACCTVNGAETCPDRPAE